MSNHPWGDSSFFWYLNSYANRTPSAVVPSPLNLSIDLHKYHSNEHGHT